MNRPQKLLIDWSLGMAVGLAWVAWVAVIILGVGTPFPTEFHSISKLTEEVIALDPERLLEMAKLLGVLLWVWLCVFVRMGRKKKQPKRRPSVGS
ncbi:hypothetical protein D9M69_686030 [compost metagenome]